MLFRTSAYFGTLYFRYTQSYDLGYIEVYLSTFGYILADSGIFRILAQLEMLMCIKVYSEPMAYSAIFKTADIFVVLCTI